MIKLEIGDKVEAICDLSSGYKKGSVGVVTNFGAIDSEYYANVRINETQTGLITADSFRKIED
jgi:hypothetical protein